MAADSSPHDINDKENDDYGISIAYAAMDDPECETLSAVRKAIYALCCMVPPGRVVSYGTIARALQPPASARAVGSAMRENPLSPSPVPCHRVLRSDLSLGGFSGQTSIRSAAIQKKIALLASEGVNIVGDPPRVHDSSLHSFSAAQLAAAAAIRLRASHGSSKGLKRNRAGNAITVFKRPGSLRAACASGVFTSPTSGHCPGFAQANLVVLPKRHADHFKEFCQANPGPCPLLEVTSPGNPVLRETAFGDVRTDAPMYRLHKSGKMLRECSDLLDIWQPSEAGEDASVGFLLGCSFSFEDALQQAGLPLRHVQLGCNVPMYKTNVQTTPAGPFKGPLVVSMRPMTPAQAQEATRITSAFPRVHGAPVHVGQASALGIADINKPDYGDAVPIHEGEVCVFWACGVTPQAALAEAALPCIIATHAPGHMLVLDVTNDQLKQ